MSEEDDTDPAIKRTTLIADCVTAMAMACEGIEGKNVCEHIKTLVKNGWKFTLELSDDGITIRGKPVD